MGFYADVIRRAALIPAEAPATGDSNRSGRLLAQGRGSKMASP